MAMKIMIVAVVVLFACSILAQQNPSQYVLDENDNDVLRFALTLENLETTFHTQFLAQFSSNDFVMAGYSAADYTMFQLIRDHEAAHVALLEATLVARTGASLPVCNYNFGTITNVTTYVGASRMFENVGQSAYDGAISAIYNRTLQEAGATIATIEARQAAYLNQLPGNYNPQFPATAPFPQAFDTANPPATVSSYIMPFIASCPYTIVLPSVYVVIPVPAPPNQPANPTTAEVAANDIAALNFALTLEILEATYYNTYLNNPANGQAAFMNAGYTQLDYIYFQYIQAHENNHVAYLTSTITLLGGTPIPNCTYNFAAAYTNVSTFVGTAQLLENTGVTAYDGAANRITNGTFRQAAATVATVEARHAAFLNQLEGQLPFPNPFDTAADPATIIATVTKNFIISCPTTPVPPNPINVYPYNSTSSSSSSSSTSTSTSSTSTSTSSTSTTHRITTSSATTIAASLSAIVAVFAILFL